MATVYLAAPLHGAKDQASNIGVAEILRREGISVYMPQEYGVWEHLVLKERKANPALSEEEATRKVRKEVFYEDLRAIQECDIVLMYIEGRGPSEGMMWEAGYAYALGKGILNYNPSHHKFNVMPELSSIQYSCIYDVVKSIKEIVAAKAEGAVEILSEYIKGACVNDGAAVELAFD